MIQISKQKDKIILTLVSELDREDVEQIVSDLQQWLKDSPKRYDNQNAGPSGLQFHNKEHEEAFQYAQKKRLMEESMKEYIASIPKTQHIQKEVQTIELDALNREVQITKTKLKENGRK